jgi:hypothetical protein
VLCSNGSGSYYVGEVISDYELRKGGILPYSRLIFRDLNPIFLSSTISTRQNSFQSLGIAGNISVNRLTCPFSAKWDLLGATGMLTACIISRSSKNLPDPDR